LFKLRPTTIILALCALIAFTMQLCYAQVDCPEETFITIGNAVLEPCTPQRVNIPVYMRNPCAVGGFSIQIMTTDPTWMSFTVGDSNAADTIGSRIGDWESFGATVTYPFRVTVTAIADMPGGRTGVFLPPGDGLIFTIHLDFHNSLVCDTSQLINYGNTMVSDTTGYILFTTYVIRDSIYILPGACSNNPRGDANCSGTTNGIDVIYLVNYLKGIGQSFCCLCSGDVNNNGSFNGIDVTYLVMYLKGQTPALEPCH
jgi:hypothetical protein